MKTLILAVLMVLGAATCSRAETAVVGEDPLTAQIRLRQLTQPNGGVTGIRVDPSGKVVKIEMVDLSAQPVDGGQAGVQAGADALKTLRPHQGLTDKAAARAGKGKKLEQPKAQLDHIEARKKW